MFNLGTGEIVVIAILALIVLGPRRLPELASGIGKVIREIRKATADIRGEIELDETIRKPLQDLRDAATLPPDVLKRQDRERAATRSEDATPYAAEGKPSNPLVNEAPWKPWESTPPAAEAATVASPTAPDVTGGDSKAG